MAKTALSLLLWWITIPVLSQSKSPTKQETTSWLLVKLAHYQIPLYEDYKDGNLEKTVKTSGFRFSFQNDLFIIEFSKDYDHGKKIDQIRAEIPINEIQSIRYTGAFTTTLVLIVKPGDMIYLFNESEHTKALVDHVKIGFWVNDPTDQDIGERLVKAFGHLEELFRKQASREPF
jgi:hypothetical protein